MFGLPRFVCSFDGCTNIGYLPRDDGAESWKDWQQPADDSFLDHRTLGFTICSEVGETLEYCATPLELIIALRDAFFGWSTFYSTILALMQFQAGLMLYSMDTCIETSALATSSSLKPRFNGNRSPFSTRVQTTTTSRTSRSVISNPTSLPLPKMRKQKCNQSRMPSLSRKRGLKCFCDPSR